MVEGEKSQSTRQRRRDFLKYSGTALATSGLAGCASYSWTPYGNTGGSGGGQATPVADVEDVDTEKFEGETFKLGILAAGKDLAFGSGVINSAKLAIEEINEGNWWLGEALDMEGLLGAELEMVHGNTKLQARQTERQYNRLTRQEDCVATFGGALPRPILRPMAAVERLHFATIPADPLPNELVSKEVSGTGNTDPEEEYEKYKYFFRPGPINTPALGESFIEFFELYAEDLGWDRIAFLVENGVEDERFMEFVPPRAKEAGLEVPIAQVTSESLTNWTPIYDEVEQANCDAAIVVQLLSGASSVNQWASQERPFALGGIHIRAQLPTFWDETAGKAESVFTMNAVTPQTTNTPRTQEFMGKYKERFSDAVDNGVPFYAGPITYDGIRQFSQAIVETGAHPVENATTLVEHLENPEEFTYLNGVIFPAFGYRPPTDRYAHDPIFDCMIQCEGEIDDKDPYGPTGVPVFQQWQEGEDGEGVMEAFAPGPNKTADYIEPPWMQ